jgi:hypothetical protein
MSELRVPTLALDAEVLCADGRAFTGRIFLPAASSIHAGPMKPDEWMNDAVPFFPFLPEGERGSVILNKHEVLVLSVTGPEDPGDADLPHGPERRLAVEVRGHVFTGTVRIDMPANQMRVLDYLNAAHRFLPMREGERSHLVRKARITRVLELPEE